MKNFPEEEAYSLSKNSAHDPSETFHPLRIYKDVCVLGGWCSTAPPGALALALGFIWRCQVGCCSWGKGTPFPEEKGLSSSTLGLWWLGHAMTRSQINIVFYAKDVISLREIVLSELSEPLSYRWSGKPSLIKNKANWKSSVNSQVEEFSFQRSKNQNSKNLLKPYGTWCHKNLTL